MRRLADILKILLCATVVLGGIAPALCGVHLWRVKEAFSNADGSIQFIEIATCCGSTGEIFTSGQAVSSTSHSFPIPANQSGSTLNKHLLLATDSFRMLPGAPTPDYIIDPHFFATTGDTISFSVYDTMVFGAGVLPTDGTRSLNKDPNDATDTTVSAVNSPTNYAGQTGSVTAVGGPPGVPDGTGGTTPMTVTPLSADGSRLRLGFDTSSCTNAAGYHILYGQRSGFPAVPGGTYTLLGTACGIGSASPYDWVGVPEPADGFGLIWFMVVATDSGGIEGSWGKDSAGNECGGSGNGGADGTCAVVKNISNTCGHL